MFYDKVKGYISSDHVALSIHHNFRFQFTCKHDTQKRENLCNPREWSGTIFVIIVIINTCSAVPQTLEILILNSTHQYQDQEKFKKTVVPEVATVFDNLCLFQNICVHSHFVDLFACTRISYTRLRAHAFPVLK